jgi:2-polyprenyl-3-methyl-5-hydroxy-6-metoxy-1,4-benzoquinol methylase
MHLAYAHYYTHQDAIPKDDYKSLGRFRKLRRRLVNGYTNWCFSTHEAPASRLGVPILLMLWVQRHRLDNEYRHLPRPPASGGRLLDVGSGSGSFVRIAHSCGWTVTGIEPDPTAAANSRRQGLNVLQGGLEQFDGSEDLFDVITINHVIEHMHDPLASLQDCYRLLKQGGHLWLQTPNIDSLGHRRFGRHWRGLEPPRHLILFNPRSLAIALEYAGFRMINSKMGSNAVRLMNEASEAIRRGVSIDERIELSVAQKFGVLIDHLHQSLTPRSREFLTAAARKTDARTGLVA